jgi:hypothetical protein
MTQELVLVVLLTGLVGLIWVMTLAILDGDRPTTQSHQPDTEHHDTPQHRDGALKHHSAAA